MGQKKSPLLKPAGQQKLLAIRDAISGLRDAAIKDSDEPRAQAADWLDGLFLNVSTKHELHTAARDALSLYRGGMGSFSDVGNAHMHEAVETLRLALRKVVGPIC